MELARRFNGLNVDNDLERYALQLVDITVNNQAGLELIDNDHNQRVIDIFRGIGWDDVIEQRVQVVVEGPSASPLSSRLRGARFEATHLTSDAHITNRIRYGVGGDNAAVLLAARLGQTVEMLPDPSLSGNKIRLELSSEPPSVILGYRTVQPPTAVATGTTQKSPPPPKTLGVCG